MTNQLKRSRNKPLNHHAKLKKHKNVPAPPGSLVVAAPLFLRPACCNDEDEEAQSGPDSAEARSPTLPASIEPKNPDADRDALRALCVAAIADVVPGDEEESTGEAVRHAEQAARFDALTSAMCSGNDAARFCFLCLAEALRDLAAHSLSSLLRLLDLLCTLVPPLTILGSSKAEKADMEKKITRRWPQEFISSTDLRRLRASGLARLCVKVWRTAVNSKTLFGASSTAAAQARCALLIALGDGQLDRLRPAALGLVDFVMEQFDNDGCSGAAPLAALRAVAHLVVHYSVDYPELYERLYQLLGPDDWALRIDKSARRLLKDLDLFLSSTHLPASYAAAFIKRLAQLSLTTPAPLLPTLLSLILNAMRRYPPCQVLVHRASALSSSKMSVQTASVQDPYRPPPLSTLRESHALDSSLWELRPLQCHWCPRVVALAKKVNRVLPNQEEIFDGQLLSLDYEELVTCELMKATEMTDVQTSQEERETLAEFLGLAC